MAKELHLNKTQEKQLNGYMKERFLFLDDLRSPIDIEVSEEVDLYNDIDKYMQPWSDTTRMGKMWWEEKKTVPYVYTINQTMVARLIQSFYGKQNYLRIYVEQPGFKELEKDIQLWLQGELDKIKLKSRSRDFLEDGLVQRTVWLYLKPVLKNDKMSKVDFNIYQWLDVWFDTKVADIEDTDFFVRNIMPMWKLNEAGKIYHNLDKIPMSRPWDTSEEDKREIYKAKLSRSGDVTYFDPYKTTPVDEVEVMMFHTWYDISWTKKGEEQKPNYQPIIVHWANRDTIIRVEQITLKTRKKFMMFPIRPIRQANSLIGKSTAQIVKPMQYLLNEAFSLTIHNFKLLVKLMFKYNKDAEIELDELWAGAGNAIGWVENKDDVDIFNIPDKVNTGLLIVSWIIQFMQQATGAVDYLMGTSAARGTTETAGGIKTITEQAMFKFQMMAENVYDDQLEFINWVMILWVEFNPEEILRRFPSLKPLTNMTPEDLEDHYLLDIGLNDLTLRRDSERTTFINGANIIAGLLEKVGGNMPAFLTEVMKKLEVENVEKIMQGAKTPQQMQEARSQFASILTQAAEEQKKGGSNKINPNDSAAKPEETENQSTPDSPES